jgi:ribosomal protein S6--L-glutamate ligase
MSALVLSRNVAIYSTRRITEAFRSRGVSTTVLDPAGICLKLGPNTIELHEGGRHLPRPKVVVPRIGVGVVPHCLAVLTQMENLGIPLTASSSAIRRSKDKMACLQALCAAGVPVPPTALARQSPDEEWAVEEVGGPPVVLKFLTGTHGVGVFLAESAESAKSILDAMWSLEKNLIVQRYIHIARGRDLRLFVVGDEVVAAIRRVAREGGFRSNLHHGGRPEALDPSPELVQLALRSSTALGLDIAGVDIIESEDGPLVLEVNSSPGLEGIEDTTGVDIAGAIVDHAISRSKGGGS